MPELKPICVLETRLSDVSTTNRTIAAAATRRATTEGVHAIAAIIGPTVTLADRSVEAFAAEPVECRRAGSHQHGGGEPSRLFAWPSPPNVTWWILTWRRRSRRRVSSLVVGRTASVSVNGTWSLPHGSRSSAATGHTPSDSSAWSSRTTVPAAARAPVADETERRRQTSPQRVVGVDQPAVEQSLELGSVARRVEVAGDHEGYRRRVRDVADQRVELRLPLVVPTGIDHRGRMHGEDAERPRTAHHDCVGDDQRPDRHDVGLLGERQTRRHRHDVRLVVALVAEPVRVDVLAARCVEGLREAVVPLRHHDDVRPARHQLVGHRPRGLVVVVHVRDREIDAGRVGDPARHLGASHPRDHQRQVVGDEDRTGGGQWPRRTRRRRRA